MSMQKKREIDWVGGWLSGSVYDMNAHAHVFVHTKMHTNCVCSMYYSFYVPVV